MKKVSVSCSIKSMMAFVIMMLICHLAASQEEDFEYLSSREFKGDVVRIEERKYYKKGKEEPYMFSDVEVFRYHKGKLMDAYQDLNMEGDYRTFRKFIYNDQDRLESIEVSLKGSNTIAQKLVLFYDGIGNINRVEKHRDGKVSFVTYQYDGNSKLVKKSKTNERGTTYQIESLTYDAEGRLSSWRSDDQVMKSKATKDYSYTVDNGFVTTTIEIVEFTGAKRTEIKTTNTLGLEVAFNEKMANGMDFESSRQYKLDDKSNWIRQDKLPTNHRKSYTLRQITYADGTVTGHLEALPDDAFIEWRSSGPSMEIQVDGKSVTNTVKSVYIHGTPDVMAHDSSTGLSFIMKGFQNDSSYTWKPAVAVEYGNELYWKISDKGLHLYYKGIPVVNSVSQFVDDDVIVYIPSAHQSFILKDYNNQKGGQLQAAAKLSLSTNVFWLKTETGSFRLIINGAYAGGTLPNEWLNSSDLVVNDESGKPRFLLRGFAKANVGKIYPATSYD